MSQTVAVVEERTITENGEEINNSNAAIIQSPSEASLSKIKSVKDNREVASESVITTNDNEISTTPITSSNSNTKDSLNVNNNGGMCKNLKPNNFLPSNKY